MSYVFVIDGEMGAGKTSFMSLLGVAMKEAYPDMELWSNYELKGSKQFRSYENFLDLAKNPFNFACLDEGYTLLDSRNSANNKAQMHFTQLLYLLRKLRTVIFFTAVDMRTLEGRVRQIIDVYIFVKKRNGYHFYEFYDFKSGKLLRRVSADVTTMIKVLSGLKLYKTWRPVSPVELPDPKTFHLFLDKLILGNDKYYELHEGDRATP